MCSMNLVTAQVFFFRDEIRGVTFSTAAPFTGTDVTVGALPSSESDSGLFDFVRTGSTGYRYIVGRTGRTAATGTLFFRLYRSLWLESEAIRLRKRATGCITKNGRFFVGLHLWLLKLHSTHAWSLISPWIILGLCFPYNLFCSCVNHCVCASYCEVNQIEKHKLLFIVVNNTFEIVTIWSVRERKTPSWRHDVNMWMDMSASIDMVNVNHQKSFSDKPLRKFNHSPCQMKPYSDRKQ